MRESIRQQVQQGKSDQEILQYFEQRYGPEIIWAPRIQGITVLAWVVPLLLLSLGVVLLFFVVREWRTGTPVSTPVAAPVQSETDVYREQIERELAQDDILFSKPTLREEKK
jgi:cytochrome c-type biogenesis protein CcmH